MADLVEMLPDDLKQEPSLKDIKDVGTLAKSFVETKKLVGASIRPPGPDAAPEAKKEFREKMLKHDPALIYFPDDAPEDVQAALWKRLGRPEKPEEYAPADGVDGLNVDELRALARATGMTKAQFKELTRLMGESTAAQRDSVAAEAAKLKTEWGAAYEERLLGAKAHAMRMGLTEAEVGNLTPKQLRAWAASAKAVGTAPAGEGDRQRDGVPPGRITPAEAMMQLGEIEARPEFFDKHRNPALHESLKEKHARLMPMAYPEG